MVINGRAHGPLKGTTTCQLHMRHFNNGDTITIEPWRAKAFPVVKDLVVDRSAFDRVIQSGGYISVNTGSALMKMLFQYLKTLLKRHLMQQLVLVAEHVWLLAKCISESFVAAKVSTILLPQGQPERLDRVNQMVSKWIKKVLGIVLTREHVKRSVLRKYQLNM